MKNRVIKIIAKNAMVRGLVTWYQGILKPFGRKSLDSRYFRWAIMANAYTIIYISFDEPATMVKTEAVALVRLISGVMSKNRAERPMAAAGTPFLEILAT